MKSNEWMLIDHWWKVHADEQMEELVELHNIMKELTSQWNDCNCRFKKDPLTLDWSENSSENGPLQTGQEENWSDWLAHLIRTSPRYFIQELFQGRFSKKPSNCN